MAQSKSQLAGVAALITSIVGLCGLTWTVISNQLDRNEQAKVQKQTYNTVKTGLEDFTGNASEDLKSLKDDLHQLQIDIAVLKEAVSNLKSSSYKRRSDVPKIEPEPPPVTMDSTGGSKPKIIKARKISLMDFDDLQQQAIKE